MRSYESTRQTLALLKILAVGQKHIGREDHIDGDEFFAELNEQDEAMKKSKSLYRGHRFPAGVISCAVCWYYRYQLRLRDIEELLFERGVIVTYETIRCWCDKFGAAFARRVKAAR